MEHLEHFTECCLFLTLGGVMPGGRDVSPHVERRHMNGDVQASVYDDLRFEDRFYEVSYNKKFPCKQAICLLVTVVQASLLRKILKCGFDQSHHPCLY